MHIFEYDYNGDQVSFALINTELILFQNVEGGPATQETLTVKAMGHMKSIKGHVGFVAVCCYGWRKS
jgi:hypothetical protein